jgi:hypothetical protein
VGVSRLKVLVSIKNNILGWGLAQVAEHLPSRGRGPEFKLQYCLPQTPKQTNKTPTKCLSQKDTGDVFQLPIVTIKP